VELALSQASFMTFVFIHLVLFLAALSYIFLVLGKKEPVQSSGKLKILRESPQNLKSIPHLILFLAFVLFLLLPLSIGLGIYLRTDANVLVVILWIFWTYNWTKYTFWRE